LESISATRERTIRHNACSNDAPTKNWRSPRRECSGKECSAAVADRRGRGKGAHASHAERGLSPVDLEDVANVANVAFALLNTDEHKLRDDRTDGIDDGGGRRADLRGGRPTDPPNQHHAKRGTAALVRRLDQPKRHGAIRAGALRQPHKGCPQR